MTIAHSKQKKAEYDEKEAGPYYSSDYPLLGVLLAVCCNRKEQWLFWEHPDFDLADPIKFLSKRYRLEDRPDLFVLMITPAEASARPCPVPEEHLKLAIAGLALELSVQRPPPPKRPMPAPLDQDLADDYPTLVALYKSYVLGDGPHPEYWAKPLLAELSNRSERIW